MIPNTETFLEQFNRLESTLKRKLGKDKYTPFSQLLREAAGKDSFIRHNRTLLESLSDLRNVLVHKEGNEIIAVPTDEAVAKLMAIADTYSKERTVLEVSQRKVITAKGDMAFFDALKLMKTHNYTKIPVYEDGLYQGLLSGNVVTRWFTGNLDGHGKVMANLSGVRVSDVISTGGKTGQVRFVPKDTEVFEFLQISNRKPSKSGVYIITHHGSRDEKPLGIITAYDYAKLLNDLNV